MEMDGTVYSKAAKKIDELPLGELEDIDVPYAKEKFASFYQHSDRLVQVTPLNLSNFTKNNGDTQHATHPIPSSGAFPPSYVVNAIYSQAKSGANLKGDRDSISKAAPPLVPKADPSFKLHTGLPTPLQSLDNTLEANKMNLPRRVQCPMLLKAAREDSELYVYHTNTDKSSIYRTCKPTKVRDIFDPNYTPDTQLFDNECAPHINRLYATGNVYMLEESSKPVALSIQGSSPKCSLHNPVNFINPQLNPPKRSFSLRERPQSAQEEDEKLDSSVVRHIGDLFTEDDNDPTLKKLPRKDLAVERILKQRISEISNAFTDVALETEKGPQWEVEWEHLPKRHKLAPDARAIKKDLQEEVSKLADLIRCITTSDDRDTSSSSSVSSALAAEKCRQRLKRLNRDLGVYQSALQIEEDLRARLDSMEEEWFVIVEEVACNLASQLKAQMILESLRTVLLNLRRVPLLVRTIAKAALLSLQLKAAEVRSHARSKSIKSASGSRIHSGLDRVKSWSSHTGFPIPEIDDEHEVSHIKDDLEKIEEVMAVHWWYVSNALVVWERFHAVRGASKVVPRVLTLLPCALAQIALNGIMEYHRDKIPSGVTSLKLCNHITVYAYLKTSGIQMTPISVQQIRKMTLSSSYLAVPAERQYLNDGTILGTTSRYRATTAPASSSSSTARPGGSTDLKSTIERAGLQAFNFGDEQRSIQAAEKTFLKLKVTDTIKASKSSTLDAPQYRSLKRVITAPAVLRALMGGSDGMKRLREPQNNTLYDAHRQPTPSKVLLKLESEANIPLITPSHGLIEPYIDVAQEVNAVCPNRSSRRVVDDFLDVNHDTAQDGTDPLVNEADVTLPPLFTLKQVYESSHQKAPIGKSTSRKQPKSLSSGGKSRLRSFSTVNLSPSLRILGVKANSLRREKTLSVELPMRTKEEDWGSYMNKFIAAANLENEKKANREANKINAIIARRSSTGKTSSIATNSEVPSLLQRCKKKLNVPSVSFFVDNAKKVAQAKFKVYEDYLAQDDYNYNRQVVKPSKPELSISPSIPATRSVSELSRLGDNIQQSRRQDKERLTVSRASVVMKDALYRRNRNIPTFSESTESDVASVLMTELRDKRDSNITKSVNFDETVPPADHDAFSSQQRCTNRRKTSPPHITCSLSKARSMGDLISTTDFIDLDGKAISTDILVLQSQKRGIAAPSSNDPKRDDSSTAPTSTSSPVLVSSVDRQVSVTEPAVPSKAEEPLASSSTATLDDSDSPRLQRGFAGLLGQKLSAISSVSSEQELSRLQSEIRSAYFKLGDIDPNLRKLLDHVRGLSPMEKHDWDRVKQSHSEYRYGMDIEKDVGLCGFRDYQKKHDVFTGKRKEGITGETLFKEEAETLKEGVVFEKGVGQTNDAQVMLYRAARRAERAFVERLRAATTSSGDEGEASESDGNSMGVDEDTKRLHGLLDGMEGNKKGKKFRVDRGTLFQDMSVGESAARIPLKLLHSQASLKVLIEGKKLAKLQSRAEAKKRAKLAEEAESLKNSKSRGGKHARYGHIKPRVENGLNLLYS